MDGIYILVAIIIIVVIVLIIWWWLSSDGLNSKSDPNGYNQLCNTKLDDDLIRLRDLWIENANLTRMYLTERKLGSAELISDRLAGNFDAIANNLGDVYSKAAVSDYKTVLSMYLDNIRSGGRTPSSNEVANSMAIFYNKAFTTAPKDYVSNDTPDAPGAIYPIIQTLIDRTNSESAHIEKNEELASILDFDTILDTTKSFSDAQTRVLNRINLKSKWD